MASCWNIHTSDFLICFKKFGVFLCFFCTHIQADAIINQKVLICGVCKDVATRLPYTITIMEKIGNLFSDYRIIVYENNSSDTTPVILEEWRSKNLKVLIISEQLKEIDFEAMFVNYPMKTEAIARARNIALNIAMSEQYKDFPYLICMDMDFRLEPSYDGFKEVFTAKQPWDAVFAYGIAPDEEYWDWFALRDYQMPIGPELLGDYWWSLPRKKKGFLNITDSWYPVYSAFGGCGIYKKSSIEGCQYSGLVTKDLGALYHRIIQEQANSNPLIQKYLSDLKKLQKRVVIHDPSASLPVIKDQNIGIILDGFPDGIIWRMNSEAYKYPASLDHATFHASMIMRGHDKLFINPRLIFRYSS